MSKSTKAGAPTGTDSAPNTTDRNAWLAEIHTPVGDYNANVPVDDIVPDPKNRKDHDQEGLKDLASQIEASGLIQPIVLRPVLQIKDVVAMRHVVDKQEIWRVLRGDAVAADFKLADQLLYEGPDERDAERAASIYRSGQGWQIIAGERRWLAHRLLKAPTIRAFIHREETDLSAATKQLLENEAREDLNPIERARGYARQIGLGMKQKDLVELVKKSQPVVSNTMRLLELPAEVQGMIIDGRLSEAHGVVLAKWARWPRACARMADMAHAHEYSAKDLANMQIPFDGTLRDNGLLEKIVLAGQYLSDDVLYILPAALKKHPDFIVTKYYAYYFLPEDPKDNVWAPVKAEQDAAHKAKQEAAAKKAAGKPGEISAAAAERKRKIEKNKKRRAELHTQREQVLKKLAGLKQPGVLELAVLANEAVAGGYHKKRIMEVADLLGMKLPAGLVGEWQGLCNLDCLAKMKPADVAKLAVAVIVHKQVDDLLKNPQGYVPRSFNLYVKGCAK